MGTRYWIGLAAALIGLALDTQSDVISDVRDLVPQDLQALRDANVLEQETGVSGEIDVNVRAADITDAKVIRWMTSFQADVLRAHGYRPGKRCTQEHDAPELCPALSLPDLFSSAIAGQRGNSVRRLLAAVPPYFSQGVVSRDRKTAMTGASDAELRPLIEQCVYQANPEIQQKVTPKCLGCRIDVAQCAGDEEVLLDEAKQPSVAYRVGRVEHLRNRLRQHLPLDRKRQDILALGETELRFEADPTTEPRATAICGLGERPGPEPGARPRRAVRHGRLPGHRRPRADDRPAGAHSER